ncbi:hypothetical protein [Actinoplanes sp. NPDC051859]|uniref:hypothetical protein n=1 Tax=Actinoplanes sp. NPDC051859 TaxID=3363909 RepID=UPI00378DFC45
MLGQDTGETGKRVLEPAEDEVVEEGAAEDAPESPVMPAPPFPTFQSRPTLPHQVPGVGFESGRDSRAR